MSVLNTLKERNSIHDASNFEELRLVLERENLPFYCGFDPTADSLHVGHLLPLVLMARLQKAGHTPIAVVGSATGMIGDPSWKSDERKLLDEATIQHNVRGIEAQIRLVLDASGDAPFIMLRNDAWLGQLSLVSFLRDVGKHFSVNAMIAKDSVRDRLENREQGISFTEFSYSLLQAFDFLWLYQNHGCRLQVGGSDQWGNITAGLDLIRRMTNEESMKAYGLTFPLLTTSQGTKFGKTEQGAVWLDRNKTSPYRFYQFWYTAADADVMRYLELFTDIPREELNALQAELQSNPEKRVPQQTLADALTRLIHGDTDAKRAAEAGSVLFGGSLESVNVETLEEIFSDVPSSEVDKESLSDGLPIQDLLVNQGICASKGAARRLLEQGGVYINNNRVEDLKIEITINHFLNGKMLLIRSGKRNYHLVRLRA